MDESSTFVDTSAIYAYLVAEDRRHADAVRAFGERMSAGSSLITSSYVLHETISLLQARVGLDAVEVLHRQVVPALDVVWIDAEVHERSLTSLLATRLRGVSLTDWTSFEVMRGHKIARVLAFDAHFRQQGFELVPAPLP